jgi:ubiquinone/menaquinone biosynthesis C-methylase UbiE
MVSLLNQFDRISKVYDLLANIAFFGAVKRSQLKYLKMIPANADVLILGGGSGWIIQEIKKLAPHSKICYVEASRKMMDMARNNYKDSNIEFIHGTEDTIPPQDFDVIFTGYYLDLFSTKDLRIVIQKIAPLLRRRGIWLVSEFRNNAWWHKIYLKLMYSFFRITCSLKNSQLPDWKMVLTDAQFEWQDTHVFFNGFIEAAVLNKKGAELIAR